MFGVLLDAGENSHKFTSPYQSLWSFLKSECAWFLLHTYLHQSFYLLFYWNLSLFALIHLQSRFLLCSSFGLSVGFSRPILRWKLLNRCLVLFFKLLQKLFLSFICTLLHLFAFLFSFCLLDIYLVSYLFHHLFIPLFLFLRVFTTLFERFGLFDKILAFLKQNLHLCFWEMIQFRNYLIYLLRKPVVVLSCLTKHTLELGDIFSCWYLLSDLFLLNVMILQLLERSLQQKIKSLGLKIHFLSDSPGIFFIPFFMVGDFSWSF